jgi:phospholipid N-methyltransferase
MIRSIRFFIESISRFKEVGTILPSSSKVAKAMTQQRYINFEHAECIVELGAGDGSITKEILKKINPKAKLLCFEINPIFVEILRKKFSHDPRIQIINDDAKKLGEYIQAAGYSHTDAVISAIPFAIIPDDSIIEEAYKHLSVHSYFIQLHYSLIVRKRYMRIFGNAVIKFVPMNIPPVFLHLCQKLEAS